MSTALFLPETSLRDKLVLQAWNGGCWHNVEFDDNTIEGLDRLNALMDNMPYDYMRIELFT